MVELDALLSRGVTLRKRLITQLNHGDGCFIIKNSVLKMTI